MIVLVVTGAAKSAVVGQYYISELGVCMCVCVSTYMQVCMHVCACS